MDTDEVIFKSTFTFFVKIVYEDELPLIVRGMVSDTLDRVKQLAYQFEKQQTKSLAKALDIAEKLEEISSQLRKDMQELKFSAMNICNIFIELGGSFIINSILEDDRFSCMTSLITLIFR